MFLYQNPYYCTDVSLGFMEAIAVWESESESESEIAVIPCKRGEAAGHYRELNAFISVAAKMIPLSCFPKVCFGSLFPCRVTHRDLFAFIFWPP